jgi:hypothetical protein
MRLRRRFTSNTFGVLAPLGSLRSLQLMPLRGVIFNAAAPPLRD